MELLSDCNDMKKIRLIENVCLGLCFLLAVVVSLPFIRPSLNPVLYAALSHSWIFVMAACIFYEGITQHKKLHIAFAIIEVLLGIWLISI
ncbi:MAG: hypothetical protein SPD80_06330 [Atopobium sp.]|uniref:hypothetical protein n=1 Tax=Atopobium sp. TaxID=1872650 RepID=UPI002A81930C|nr:hypothetical protein [Atopobium sp.]MDY4523180.1 hypothetical protein [Atopobium sp.]